MLSCLLPLDSSCAYHAVSLLEEWRSGFCGGAELGGGVSVETGNNLRSFTDCVHSWSLNSVEFSSSLISSLAVRSVFDFFVC